MSLFDPIRLGAVELPNRIVMPPMGRTRADKTNRAPTPLMETYYAQRASAGLIISEGSQVSPLSVSRPGSPAIHSDEQVAGWRRVTDAVHARGGRIFQQLSHHGRRVLQSRLPAGERPIAPSAVASPGFMETKAGREAFAVPRALEIPEIEALVGEYAAAARNARAAGFDGIEIHGASGLLVDQFVRDGSNQRTDRYGGAIENRARFLLEIVDRISLEWEPGRIGVRLSPHFQGDIIADSDPIATFGYVATELGRRKIAYLHLVEPLSLAEDKRLAANLRRAFGGPVIVCGEFTLADARRAVAEGQADLVAFGRAYIANPDLVERFNNEAPLNPPDPSTFYSGGAQGYTDYPTL
jgi:N-ethylmaleimide reductase